MYLWLFEHLAAPVNLPGPVEIDIPRGASFPRIVDILANAGLIREPALVRLLGRYLGLASSIKAGKFRFQGSITAKEVLRRLTIPPQREQVEVTLPEGLNIWQVAAMLGEAGATDAEKFLKIASNPESASAIVGHRVESLEGYLFPDTYRFHPGSQAQDVARVLVARFDREWNALKQKETKAYEDLSSRLGFSDHDLIILASLVEKEAKTEHDRRLVARVMFNRLKAGWTLDVDPTCVYGRDTWRELPTRSRCRDPNNRWSTYVNHGLPPGPIANPGSSALRAVLHPADTKEAYRYYFYVLKPDGSGEHVFSATRAEHNRAVRRYWRSRRRK